IAVSVATENAAITQQSLSPLFANLNAVVSSNDLPPALQTAIVQVLAQQTSLDETLSGGDVQNAFKTSGLLLECSSAAGATPANGSVPDLKAALIVLRQTLSTTLESAQAVTPATSVIAAASAKPSTASPTLAPSLAGETDGHQVLPQVRPSLPDV